MKPTCKAETAYIHWRCDFVGVSDKFTKWSKNQMNRARRRFSKDKRRCDNYVRPIRSD